MSLPVALNRITNSLCRALFACGGVLLLMMLGLTLGNIILRAVGLPLRGVVEISGFLSAAAIGLCLPRAQRTASHIEAGMLNERLPDRVRKALQVGVSVLVLGFMIMATLEILELALYVREMNEVIEGWNISYDVLVFSLALGCGVQALVLVDDMIQAFAEGVRRGRLSAWARAKP